MTCAKRNCPTVQSIVPALHCPLLIFPTKGGTFGNHLLVTRCFHHPTILTLLPRNLGCFYSPVISENAPASGEPKLTAVDIQDNHAACAPLRTKMPKNTCPRRSHMTFTDKNCIFDIQTILKTSKSGMHLGHLEFRSFEGDKNLCIVTVLTEYVNRTKLTRGN